MSEIIEIADTRQIIDNKELLTNEQIIERAAKEHEQYMTQAALLDLTARSDQQTDRDQQGRA